MMHSKLCVTKQLRPKVLVESHAPPYAGHRGIDATVKAVETFFYWPALRRDVDAYVRSCLVRQKVKFGRQKAPGLLQPLPIPDRPWESIAMDLVFDLPRTTTGNDGIWTIICRFSKQAHFIPVRKKIKPEHMVKIFMQNIFKYHGMPQSIVSDRDPRMTSLFWKALFENMGTTLKFSSSFHPQTDGQSEEANSTVLDLLKCYVSEHKAAWEQYLPLVEYAYNNTVHSSTGKAPFEIVEGGKKVPPILHTKDKIFEADRYVEGWQEAYKKVKYALEKRQAKQKRAADSHCRELLFKENDWVLLRFENIFKYHGMPQSISIVSDKDPRMTSLFWKALFENMGTILKFSSSFHPQTDGQSEEANSTVLYLLKCFVSEHKAAWEQYLPLVEYAYNNTVHSSTGKAPFEIVEGGKKVPSILHTKDKIFEADRYVEGWQEAYKKVKYALEKTQAKQNRAADSHRRELLFKENDWVLLRFEKARLRKRKGKERLFPKLSMRYYGPFQPEVEELDEILIPEQILAHKDRKVKGKVARCYLVKFKNYSPMDAKWMEEAELADSPQLLQLYKEAFLLESTVT
ncbi:hypothetical protein L7F22_023696 [Adiantum nelumboides]|nr:hypothetical protein [Adiantum nelumboides]